MSPDRAFGRDEPLGSIHDDGYIIRGAKLDELVALRSLERAAAFRFSELGLHEVACAEPLELEVLADARRHGRLWVACERTNVPVAFALAGIEGEVAYLHELSVLPDHGRRGLGTRLVATVCSWARTQGFAVLTLATFADVPWNAPFYARLGFRILPESELTAVLLEARRQERALGLPVERRVFMQRAL